MVNSVTYIRKPESLSVGNRTVLTIKGAITGNDLVLRESKSWQDVFKNWDTVDGETFGLTVRAMNKPSVVTKAHGGVVCF